MAREIDEIGLREQKEVILPYAKPPQEIAPKYDPSSGIITPGRMVAGSGNAGTIPMKEKAHEDFPRAVYLHPKKPWKKMFLPVDGHGNKEWQWVANEAQSKTVANEEELAQAEKQGWKRKHYIAPPMPSEDPEEEAVNK